MAKVFSPDLPVLSGKLLGGLTAYIHLPGRLLGLNVGGSLILAIRTLGLYSVCLLQPPEDICAGSDGPALWVRFSLLTHLSCGPSNSPFLFPGESREVSQR